MNSKEIKSEAAKAVFEASTAQSRLDLAADQVQAAKKLVKQVKIKFKLTRKSYKQARKIVESVRDEKKKAHKDLENALARVEKYRKQLEKIGTALPSPRTRRQPSHPAKKSSMPGRSSTKRQLMAPRSADVLEETTA